MVEILEVLNRELKRRKENAKEFMNDYKRLEEENKKLKHENEMLRKDLQELSKEHFKNINNGKEKTNKS